VTASEVASGAGPHAQAKEGTTMPGLGHLPELIILLVVALLVFGPKRMIEMGSALGKSLAELRRSLKDVPGLDNLTSLGGLLKDDGDNEPRHTPFSVASQFAQNLSIESKDETPATPAPASPTVVDAAPVAPPELAPSAPAAAAHEAPAPHVVPVTAAPEAPVPHIVPVTAPTATEPRAE
jgi:TatA/E family protein of Tat protein translocase